MIIRWIVRVVALSMPACLVIALVSPPDYEPRLIATALLGGWFYLLLFHTLFRLSQEPRS